MSQGILFHQSKEGIFVYVHISESEKKAANKINCDLVPLVRIISWLPTRGRWRLFIKRKWWKYLSLLSNFSWSFHTPAPLGRTKHNSTSQVNHIFSFQVSSHCYFFYGKGGRFCNNDATKLKGKKVAQKGFTPSNVGSTICKSWKSCNWKALRHW